MERPRTNAVYPRPHGPNRLIHP